MTARLTRTYRFSASHRLHVDTLDEEANRNLFGKCNNPFGHGHNYVLSVTVKGTIDPETGILLPVSQLDAFVHQEVVSQFDHRYLNRELPEFASQPATTENMALIIRDRLQARWNEYFGAGAPVLAHLQVQETKRNAIELAVIN